MMKQYFLSFSFFALSASYIGAVEIPYSSYIADTETKQISSDWILEDANGDNKTWFVDTDDNNLTKVTECPIGVKYQYHGSNNADDWLFSPAFSLIAGNEYTISFWIKETNSNKEKFEVWAGTTAVAADYADATPIAVYDKNIGNTWRHESITFTPEETAEYHIGLRACSEKNQYNLLMRGFSIKDNKLYPAAPANLLVIPSPDKTLKATVSWTLPVTDDEGNPLSKEITGINVKRNGENIASLPGDATEYTDENVPEPGMYEYEVSALLDNAEGLGAKVVSKWIGIKTAQTLPYSENFNDPDFYETFWSTLDVNDDAKQNASSTYPPLSNAWCFMSNAMKNAHWAVIYSSRNAEVTDDDWLFSAPLAFPAKGKYKVSFRLCSYNYGQGVAAEYELSVLAGKNEDPDAMEIEIATIDQLDKTAMNPNTDGTLFEYEFDVETPGAYYIGFHSTTPASTIERQIRLGAFNVEVVELAGEEALVPPYRSESDPNWSDKDELTFILMPGYYHVSWQTEGEVSVDSTTLDKEFSEEYAVVKVIEEGNAVFASTQPFTSFEIAAADHTPAVAEECSYTIDDKGNLEFSFVAPLLNISGSALYEVEGVRIYANDSLIGEGDSVTPGEATTVSIENSQSPLTRAEEPVYSIVLHNLSGESEPVIAVKNLETGVEEIALSNNDTRLYLINGMEINPDRKILPGVYIEIKNGKAHKVIQK